MKPFYEDSWNKIYCGDCREIAPQLGLFTGIVTDPPYGLGFMGREWDTFDKSQFGRKGMEGGNDLKVKKDFNALPRYKSDGLYEFVLDWATMLNTVCKPGSFLLSFGGTRTFHKIAMGIEDGGWELRDTVMWTYGMGFPKSYDISKGIDKRAGAKREVITRNPNSRENCGKENTLYESGTVGKTDYITSPSTIEAQLWDGYGTGLKPSWEPILVCMKPVDKTFVNNALKHGVAGLNIDGSRIVVEKISINGQGNDNMFHGKFSGNVDNKERIGRFPANIILDGSEEVADLFPYTKTGNQRPHQQHSDTPAFGMEDKLITMDRNGDEGSSARFFYTAKPSKEERDRYIENISPEQYHDRGCSKSSTVEHPPDYTRKNNHITVKPLALMKYLVKLIAPPRDGLILDPFMGSGTTLLACRQLGVKSVGIEFGEHNCEIAAKRLSQGVLDFNRATDDNHQVEDNGE
jgi:DNA modification methylase